MINQSKTIFFVICLLSFSRHSFASAPPQKIVLNNYVDDVKSKKAQLVIPIYKYTGQPFEDPINNGVVSKKGFGHFNAKLPNMSGYKDTCYGFIYFGGLSHRDTLPGYTFIVVANNKRQFNSLATIWVDRNHNLDLNDDGPPLILNENIGYVEISLNNPNVKNAAYSIYISRFSLTSNESYKSLMDEFYKSSSGSKVYVGTQFSFKEQRLNIIAGDYKDNYDSFRLAIKDVNCNGVYNEETDFIIIGDYKTQLMPDNKTPIESKMGSFGFERNGKKYLINDISPIGNYIIIQEDIGAKLTKTLVVGKKLKKFKFKTPEKEEKLISIKKYKKKPTYIYIWNFEQDSFSRDTQALRIIAQNYSDKINLITLNYGETPKEIRAFVFRNHINWTIGMSTQKINEQLFLEKYPFGLLTEKRLKIKQLKISPKELLLLLQNNKI